MSHICKLSDIQFLRFTNIRMSRSLLSIYVPRPFFVNLPVNLQESSGNWHIQHKFSVPPLLPQVHKDKAVIYLVYFFGNGVLKVHLADRLSIPHSKASQWESNNCSFSNFTKWVIIILCLFYGYWIVLT